MLIGLSVKVQRGCRTADDFRFHIVKVLLLGLPCPVEKDADVLRARLRSTVQTDTSVPDVVESENDFR